MTVRVWGAGALASALLLTGCATAPVVPDATQQEIAQYRAEEARDWWVQSFGGPQPEVSVIETIPQDDWPKRMVSCVEEAGVQGLTLDRSNGLYFDPLPEQDQLLYRAYFICYQQYPYEITDPAAEGIYSRAQIENLYGYFSTRLAPCLRFLGITVGPAPTEEQFVDTFYGMTIWNPYYWVQPGSVTWSAIDRSCPGPPEPFEFLHP